MPHITVLVRKGDFSGRVVAKTRADASGAFRVALPPGTYTLIRRRQVRTQTVTVEPGHYVTVTLMIEASKPVPDRVKLSVQRHQPSDPGVPPA